MTQVKSFANNTNENRMAAELVYQLIQSLHLALDLVGMN
jgi:hypothetical protein